MKKSAVFDDEFPKIAKHLWPCNRPLLASQVKRVRVRVVGPEVHKHKKLELINGFLQVRCFLCSNIFRHPYGCWAFFGFCDLALGLLYE